MTWHGKGSIVLCGVLVLSLIANGVLYSLWKEDAAPSGKDIDVLYQQYPLLSSRALRGSKNDVALNFYSLRQKLRSEVAPYQEDFAFYFEYLPTGTSIGVNEDSEFTAASLLKVPVVMAYYSKKERSGDTTDPIVKITKNELNDKFGTLYQRGEGSEIQLSEAVRLAIEESDNTASLILADQISDDDFKYVYEGLDIPLALKGDSPIITAQQYTSVLKALYFSSILTKHDSQAILDLMTKTKFNTMLTTGVPENVQVAHKIGLIDDQIYQDCGIVYLPNRPYTVCMISKSDKDTAKKRMSTISKIIYEYVSDYDNQIIPAP